jgi:hypothetical protein
MSLFLAVLLLTGAATSVQDVDPLSQFIVDLGHERATVRESALQALIASGPKAIPRLREALRSLDVEVQQRASRALVELERDEKLAGVMRARPPLTLSLQAVPFARALEEVARRTGIEFKGAVNVPDRAITATFTRAPLMQVLDVLAAGAELQWSFEDDGTVRWSKDPPVLRPSCYSGGFRVSLRRVDVYRSWNFQSGDGFGWLYLEAKVEPGIRPIGLPRFELCEIRDEAGNEVTSDSEMQGCFLVGPSPGGVGRKSGALYESSPFTLRLLERPARKLSRIRGRAAFLFPLDTAVLEIVDLTEEATATRGELVFQVSDILTTSLKLTLRSRGAVGLLSHHVNVESLILIDAEAREYVRGTDFEVSVDPTSVDMLLYCVVFNDNVRFQPVALRVQVTGRFFEKVVPFEFKDVLLP